MYFVERQQTATSQTSSKDDNDSTGYIFSTDEKILRGKNKYGKQ